MGLVRLAHRAQAAPARLPGKHGADSSQEQPREELRCVVTDDLHPFLVPSATGALSPGNLYSAKQSGRRSLLWSAVFFQPQKGDYEPLRRQAGGARKRSEAEPMQS